MDRFDRVIAWGIWYVLWMEHHRNPVLAAICDRHLSELEALGL